VFVELKPSDILASTTAQILLATLLPCHLLVTKTHLHVFAALQSVVEDIIGKMFVVVVVVVVVAPPFLYMNINIMYHIE
jgi:hypothetical protein